MFIIKTIGMRRSKYGYLLLALLVITGLAGTITSSITGKERKVVTGYFKDTKNDVLKAVKELSQVQLNYKVPGQGSIKQCIFRFAVSEKNLWDLMQINLNQPANPEKRTEIKCTDKEILDETINPEKDLIGKKIHYKTSEEALEDFKKTRMEHIKYMKGTTEDLRNHIVQTSLGWIDCYQVCLLMSSINNYYLRQIDKIKADPNFPAR
jgi:hypothetical protein